MLARDYPVMSKKSLVNRKVDNVPIAEELTLLRSRVVCLMEDFILDTPGTPEELAPPAFPGPFLPFAFLSYGACLFFLFPPSEVDAFCGRLDMMEA